jgi:uncharacterized protein (UPF0332 family)
MATITQNELLLISKASQEKLKNFAQGASLCERSGESISDLRKRAAKDRIKLARLHLKDARKLLKAKPPLARGATSRAYYSMYHAARAVAYISFGGDDHESHSALPMKMPDDFPDVAAWKIKLKDARLERNRADYDPYPKSDRAFQGPARQMLLDAQELVSKAETYIVSKA